MNRPYATSLGDILDDEIVRKMVRFFQEKGTGSITINAKHGKVRSVDIREIVEVAFQ